MNDMDTTYEQLDGLAPFPWQQELSGRFMSGTHHQLERVVTTALAAKAEGANLPRWLVYLVDRPGVVDQEIHEAQRLRDRNSWRVPLPPVLWLDDALVDLSCGNVGSACPRRSISSS